MKLEAPSPAKPPQAPDTAMPDADAAHPGIARLKRKRSRSTSRGPGSQGAQPPEAASSSYAVQPMQNGAAHADVSSPPAAARSKPGAAGHSLSVGAAAAAQPPAHAGSTPQKHVIDLADSD